MQFDQNTPRNEVTIQGEKFTVPAPFAEGHTLTPGEAIALNQVLTENARNNFAGKIKKAREAGTDVPSQADLDAYVSEYEFGVRRTASAPVDPVEKEARSIARDKVRDALKRKGIAVKDVDAAKMNGLVDQVLEQHGDKLRAHAAKIVKQRDAIAGEVLDIAA